MKGETRCLGIIIKNNFSLSRRCELIITEQGEHRVFLLLYVRMYVCVCARACVCVFINVCVPTTVMDSCSLPVRAPLRQLFEIITSANVLRRRRVLCTKARFHFSQRRASPFFRASLLLLLLLPTP